MAAEGIRKGRTCGTVVVDLERRRVADLLPDRTSATMAEWLRQRPGVEVVARDCSTEYAPAASIGAPGAVQVADRWHLLANMRQALEHWLHTVHARLRRLSPAHAGASDVSAAPPRRDQAFRCTGPERAARAERHGRWHARYEEVRRRHLAGEPLMAIARAMGFAGGNKQAHRWLAERRTVPAKVGRRRVEDLHDAGAATDRRKDPLLPAARPLAWLLVQPVAALDATATAVVRRVEQDRDAAVAANLARRFTALVRACGLRGRQDGAIPAAPVAELDAWLTEAPACGIGAVETFATGLEVDGAAVRAALTEPWSSGQAEGQVNRLKLLKRQNYGRAKFDLLRQRVLLAA